MFDWIADPNAWASLLTLAALEIVLGVDNLIFLAITVGRLPREKRALARRLGLAAALVLRLALLASVVLLSRFTQPIASIGAFSFSVRDLILIGGGAFLLYKGTQEIHGEMEAEDADAQAAPARQTTLPRAIVSIMLLDLVFSIDSVITAVGLSDNLMIMSIAVVLAMGVMLAASRPVARFINRHPTVKMLALSFLLLIGMVLVADGFSVHVPRGFIYAAIGFSAFVEALNQVRRRKRAAKS